jgi:hypothetical protein
LVISLLVGLLSGNGLTALFRSLGTGAVFALAGFGLQFAARHFLPELFEPPEEEGGDEAHLIDISVGDAADASTGAKAAEEAAPLNADSAASVLDVPASGAEAEHEEDEFDRAVREGLDAAAKSDYNEGGDGFVPLGFDNDDSGDAEVLKHKPQDMARAIETVLNQDKG